MGYDRTGYRFYEELELKIQTSLQLRVPGLALEVREDWAQVPQALVGPPQVVARPLLAQRVQVRELRVVEKVLESLARWPLDQDRDAAASGERRE